MRPARPSRAALAAIGVAWIVSAGCGSEDSATPAGATGDGVESNAAGSNAAESASATTRPHGGIDMNDVELCSSCHENIGAEWQRSMHAQAHASRDPIFGKMRELRTAREGEGLPSRCASCHGPREPSAPDGALAQAGVTCATCHQLAGVDRSRGNGARALEVADGAVVRGPHGLGDVPSPHTIGEAAPWITDGQTLCRACHHATRNAQGVAACTTGPEFDEGLAAAGIETTRRGGVDGTVTASAGDLSGGCTGCHMPVVDRPSGVVGTHSTHRSHEFFGPHHLWTAGGEGEPGRSFMASAVALTGRWEDGELIAELQNRTGHGVPSAFPGRMMLVKVVGFDAEGHEVWTNFTDAPPRQDPQAVFNKVYLDAEGHPSMPPYGVELARDNRLRPGESRTLRWDEIPASVTRARVTLLYRLVPPPLVARLELAGSPLAEARPFVVAEFAR